jgi:hypothetical protein
VYVAVPRKEPVSETSLPTRRTEQDPNRRTLNRVLAQQLARADAVDRCAALPLVAHPYESDYASDA